MPKPQDKKTAQLNFSSPKKDDESIRKGNVVITVAASGNIIGINELALQFLRDISVGFSGIGDSILNLIPADQIQNFTGALQSAFEGYIENIPFIIAHLNKPYTIHLIPNFDDEGFVINVKSILKPFASTPDPEFDEDSYGENSNIFQSLFHHHPDAVFSIDVNGKFLGVNPSGLNLSEGTLGQLLHHDFAPLIQEEDRAKVFGHFHKALKGEIQNYDAAFVSLKGTKKTINIINIPIVRENNICGVFGIAKDITTYEKERLQIKHGYQRFQKILDQSLDIICTIDNDGNFTEVSAASFKILGYQPEELIGKKYLDFVHPEDFKKTVAASLEIINGIEKTNFSNRYITKDGNAVPLIWSAGWDLEENLMYCAARDASEIIKAEKIIHQERSMLRTIIDNIPDHIFAIDKQQNTILTNKKFYSEYLGKDSESETLGLLPVDYFSPAEGKQIMEDNQKVMETGKPVVNRRDVVYDYKGNKEIILLTKVPFKTESNELAGLVGIARDITDSHNFENEQKLIYKLTKALGKAPDHISALQKTIKLMSGFFDFHAAEAWEIGFDNAHIRKVAHFSEKHKNSEDFDNTTRLLKDEGLPGITWQNKEMQIWEDLQIEERISRKNLIQNKNFSLGIGVPILVKDEVIAVLVFFGDSVQKGVELKPALERIAMQLSSEIKRKMTENQLNNMFRFAPNLIAVVGLDGFLKKVNPAFQRIFGYTEEELLNTPFMQFLHKEEIEYTYERLKEVASGLTPKAFQNRCRSKNGEWKWISWTPSELIEEEGIVHLFGLDITPIKTLNLELLQYRNLIESSKDGVLFISIEPENVFINSALRNILNLPQEQNFSREDVESFYANKKTAKTIFSTLLAGKYFNGDIQLKNSQGEILDYQLSGGPVFNEAGELIAVFSVHTDVKDRKAYEVSLKVYGDRINNILESITDGFFSLNSEWEVTYWNREAEKLTLINRDTVINKNLWDYFDSDRKSPLYQIMREAMAKGEKVHFEEYFQSLNKWLEVSVYPGRDGLSVYFKDITEKKSNNEEIRAAKERYDLVANATGEAVYDWNIVNNAIEWSNVYYQFYGYMVKGKFEGKDQWVENIHSEDRPMVLEKMKQAIDSKKIKWECEYRLIKQNTKIAWVLERGFIIRDKNGVAQRMIGALQNITLLKENERTLEELNYKLQKHANDLSVSNAELEQFAYIASHDLQEPLRMVSSFLSQLQRKYNDQLDDKARQYIYFATDGAVRMRQIILDLLEFSRVGKLNYDFEEIDLNSLLNDIILLHENLITESSAIIQFKNLPVIKAAITPLQRVISNLISNSIKYNSNPPVIKITVEDHPQQWQINVNDNGIGVDTQFREKIFIIFQRLHSRDQYSGTGIGLAICKKIVENHGGKIWVTSKEGEGSTFHFTILKHF